MIDFNSRSCELLHQEGSSLYQGCVLGVLSPSFAEDQALTMATAFVDLATAVYASIAVVEVAALVTAGTIAAIMACSAACAAALEAAGPILAPELVGVPLEGLGLLGGMTSGGKTAGLLTTRVAAVVERFGAQTRVNDAALARLAEQMKTLCGTTDNTGGFELQYLGASWYESPNHLLYGPDPNHGHRILHVLAHGSEDLSKPIHTVFDTGSKGILETVDEAWLLRSADDVVDQQGVRTKYVIPMGRQVGLGGETKITIIVDNGDEIVTAFPSP